MSRSGPSAAKGHPLYAIVVLGVLPLALAAAWLVATAIRGRPGLGRQAAENLLTVDRPFPAGGRFAGDPYVGSRACAPCHPGESAQHARSGHAATLMPAGRVALSRRLNGIKLADPERPDDYWEYHTQGGRPGRRQGRP
jgi:hypothetical protein